MGALNVSERSCSAAGNQTEDPSNLSAHTYQWDAEGRVASVDGGSTWSFTYNALGHRVKWASPSGGELHLFDPEGNWLGNANSYTLVRFGERALVISTGSETDFNHINNIGSTTMWTNHTGSPVEDMLFYPWGDVWLGSGGYNFAYLPYRDLSTNTDITTARFISPNFGRWLSPDALGGDLEDPQTLNKYAYVRNNPTTLTDPTGLDFYLTCQQEGSSCGHVQGYGGLYQGTTTTTTDANGNTTSTFTPTVVTSASLQDPNSGNTAVVNANGVQLTTANGTSEGVFINGTPSATIQGDPKAAGWSDFTFNIFGSDVGHGNLDYGSFTYKWSRDQADVVQALNKTGAFTYTAEDVFGNPFHSGQLNFRFSSGAHPELFDYGPSPHLLVPNDPRATVPVGPGYVGQFHIDSHTGNVSHGGCALFGVGCQ